jgi:exonuclease 3'-5' domain-containing protein 1
MKDKLKAFLPILLQLEGSLPEKPELSCDCEGCNLGRHGSLTIFQMRVRSLKHTYVFDVLAFGGRAMFEMEGNGGQSLKKTMESLQANVFWDTRQDSDAMLHHFGVRLGGVIDAQLMEIAARSFRQRDKVSSLKDAFLVHGKAWMTGEELWEWRRAWNEAKDYVNESRYECFKVRPLSYQALMYSAGDVDCVDKLYDILLPKMNEKFRGFVRSETYARVASSLLKVMPGGSNLAPASISNIPYEWPAPLSRWAEDPESNSSTGASTPSTIANSINMTNGSATDTSSDSGKTTTNSLAMSVAKATKHEVEGLMPNSGADVGCQEWIFPKEIYHGYPERTSVEQLRGGLHYLTGLVNNAAGS